LEDRYATGRTNLAQLEKRIVETSLKYQVLCRFTAFVAVDVKEVVNQGGQVQKITQPVDPAAGWDMLKLRREPGLIKAGRCLSLGAVASHRASAAEPMETETVDSMLAEFTDTGTTETDFDAAEYRSETFEIMKALPRRKRQTKKMAATGYDLSAYRQRAQEQRDRLEQATDRLRELGVLVQRLEELIDDLQSIGAPEPELQPLADLLAELRTFMAGSNWSADEIREMGTKCDEVLGAFAGATKDPARRKAFWK
jgi:Ca-activated chloride channel family protein